MYLSRGINIINNSSNSDEQTKRNRDCTYYLSHSHGKLHIFT
ncbi:hypothetical protein SL28_03207 [Klebsiella pneumoniae]|nr:hypothetical protein AF16_00326 [Klebsiella pneumoniae CHS 60]EZQ90846.1 hypothetical protein AF03_00371 [Klebsiella pneumoniae CHS 47]EZR02576.1 hypothetical protein AE98_00206 [Klebsiella pneumoniae CHS 42]EZR07651.1 hypothetical protein AE72_00631 [Klebsiella pneumoniae CHS 16]KDH17797.1 hypothetical protein AE35_01598 [Klebsiella pneumoniae BIDMC 60]KDH34148.1 hypothetical protein AE43_01600 [Klebsiella pneumoniae BIDMC 68]KDH65931.1 hypothetical protein AE58_01196 [Klebsiella pneumoni